MRPLAVSCGEPAGVGLECLAAAWERLAGSLPFLVIGDPAHVRAAAGGRPVAEIATAEEAADAVAEAIPVLPLAFPAPRIPGRPAPENAPAVVAAIERAVSLARAGQAAGLVTLPISKQALREGAGFAFSGHTEFLAALAGGVRPVMMLAAPGLRVVPVTVHVPLAEVPAALSPVLLEETLRITARELRRLFAISAPRIAVAGLNPHAGEGGHIGREEIEIIAPVLDRLRAEGLAVSGPHPADTMFHPEARAGYDAAVAMYHDQALIPLKTLDFHRGVNVTLGLPFVRTSPDHGTAFDIAGSGRARPDSTLSALRLAAELAGNLDGD